MRLIEKIVLLMLGISLLPLAIAGSILYSSSKNSVQHQVTRQLNSIATIQKNRLVDIRNQKLTRLADFTSRSQLRTQLNAFNQTGSKSSQLQIAAIIGDAKKLGPGIQSITVMNTTGQVVASTQDNSMAMRQVSKDLYMLGSDKNSSRLAISPVSHKTIFYLGGPLELENKKIGVVGIEMSADELLKAVADRTGLGETGEIALGQKLTDGSLSYITPLRFDPRAANHPITDSKLPMYKALMGQEAVFTDIKDYRGHRALATTRYIGDSGWGVVVKIDRSEAFLPLAALRSQFLLLAFIISVLVVFASIAIARYVTQPILDIDEVAEQTSRGSLDKRVSNMPNDEIGNLAATFNDMLDKLEELDKAKNDFVSLASHQLRTPLTATKWISEELLLPAKPLSNSRKEHYLRRIHASNERMIRLVNELLDASRVGFGTLSSKPEMVQVEEVLKLVLRDTTPEVDSSGVKVITKVSKKLPATYIDRTWVQVVLQNLISNALKYSKPGQHVNVMLSSEKDEILIKVEDSGCGIPKSQQNKIFTKLFRADNARQLVGDGSGLGLYITKALIEQAGGKIWFESVENTGTTFYVKLPVIIKKTVK